MGRTSEAARAPATGSAEILISAIFGYLFHGTLAFTATYVLNGEVRARLEYLILRALFVLASNGHYRIPVAM
jgi:hypothetical protein